MLDNTVCGRDRHKLLNILCKMCSRQQMIPKSMHMANCLDEELTEEYDGGHANIFKGEHKGRAVAIKVLRLYLTSDFDKHFRVSMLTTCTAGTPIDTRILDVLPRSRRMEAPPAPEHPAVAGCESGPRTVQARHDIRMDGSR